MIPVANRYQLFAYAYDLLPAGRTGHTGQEPFEQLHDLLAQELIHVSRSLLRRGLPMTYRPVREATSRPRGRINLLASLRHNAVARRQLVCEYNLPTGDMLPNQIVRATLNQLARSPQLHAKLRPVAAGLAQRFRDVRDIALSPGMFTKLRQSRWPRLMQQAVSLSELLMLHRLPTTATGTAYFTELVHDELLMARVFERFVRNFYRREQTLFPRVGAERWPWQQIEGTVDDLALLPELRTDVCLTSAHRKIVIETKWTPHATSQRFDKAKLRSEHLYQLLAYLTNQRPAGPTPRTLEGLLLYAGHGVNLRLRYHWHGIPITVATLDLTQPWPTIHAELLQLLESESVPKMRTRATDYTDEHRSEKHQS